MEISSVFGNGFQHIIGRPLSLSPPLVPSPTLPSSTATAIAASPIKISQFAAPNAAAAASTSSLTIHDDSRSGSSIVSTTSREHRVRISDSARQSARLDIEQSSNLKSALARSGAILKAQDLNFVLRNFGKLNRWQELSQLFDWMRQNKKANFASYSSYIKFMGRSLNPKKALELYNSIKDKSIRNHVSVCNSILSCLVRNGKFDSGIELFHQMKQDGLKPDIVTYSSLLAGCTKIKGGYAKALKLVQELKYNALQMDAVTYGTLMSVCASNNQWEEAERYFDQMKDEGHSPNVFHYSSLLNAYSVDGNYSKADELVKEMKSAGLVPNKVILTTLLKVYVRGGLFDKSRELLNELKALGYAQDEMPYCLLMDGLAKAGRIEEAKLVFEEMERRHVRTDGYSYSIMISAFCRNGLLTEAKQLASDFEAKYDKYDLVIMNTMLCAYCRTGEMENVMKMMKKMDELAIVPDWNTFHILIKYFCKEKLYMLAYRTMQDMHSKGHHVEEELASLLIYQLGQTGAHSEAFSVYNMLRYSKRTMCKALHEKMLHILIAGNLLKDAYVIVKDNAKLISRPAIKKFANSFMKSGNINLINDVMKAIHSSGYKIYPGLFYSAILRYISQPEKKELLLHLLQWMPGHGYFVDSSTRNLLIRNSHLFGQRLIAEALSKQHTMLKASRSQVTKKK